MSKRISSAARPGAVIIVLYPGLVYTAKVTEHWNSSVTQEEFRLRLQEIHVAEYTHP
jgi:hypothetical protein